MIIITTKRLIFITIAMALIWLSPILFDGHKLKPYTSDGCSSFPDGTISQRSLWADCCFAHDIAYWQGGTKQQKTTVDENLAKCVSKTGSPHIAKLMLNGVKVGGSAYFPTSFRWGYGWHYPRTYQPLSSEEKQMIIDQLEKQQRVVEALQKRLLP
ncbi:MAG: hypothetical protein KAH22_04230 [Thiotrichaceae bacterium]|nr:hypothetical protein [Thiotrichaceae bacterium]